MDSSDSPHGVSPQDQSLCSATLLRKASRRLSQLYDAALLPAGLTATQYALLVEIDRRRDSPPTLTGLAAAMVMNRSGLGHGLRPLERDGLIALVEGDQDRRLRHIIITAKGKTLMRSAKAQWERAEKHLVSVLGAEEVRDIRSRLSSIAHNEKLSNLPK
jgi:DNA-binding MarR family transcriptional regulator